MIHAPKRILAAGILGLMLAAVPRSAMAAFTSIPPILRSTASVTFTGQGQKQMSIQIKTIGTDAPAAFLDFPTAPGPGGVGGGGGESLGLRSVPGFGPPAAGGPPGNPPPGGGGPKPGKPPAAGCIVFQFAAETCR